MILRRAEALDGFQRVIALQTERVDENSTKAIVFGHLAAKLMGNEAEAGMFLDNPATAMNDTVWPAPAIKFLQGALDESGLMARAKDDLQRADVHCILGLDDLIKDRPSEALAHFRWIRDHGSKASCACAIALAEIDRMEKPVVPAASGPP